ncbi:transmembrane protein 179-like isoform X1 [Acanthaster planci]|uniref:Transmembrane protein 179-like isoform X1 n=1 Tax=Acanthaster planci TaxID=133434 RepID=A0A8B7YN94_ACAPL|nr:transmembrane protein 179-like isoform X1 [Acanthaster planci]XP_022094738.1 transmembrane protein 179-like isoform X1 [Acanthaster planci]
MGIGNILMLCQVTAYVMCSIFAFFVFAPMAVNKNGEFAGNCLLFAQGNISGTKEIVIESWGPAAGCNFAITIGVFALLVSITQIVRLAFHVYYETDSSFIGVFGTFVVNVIMTIMLFASAINVTQGYSVWCQLIDRVAECSVAGFITNLWGNLKGIKPDNYAVELGMVQFGLWTELLLWTVISILSVVKLAKYHQREHIFRSLNRERERLLGSYNQPDF